MRGFLLIITVFLFSACFKKKTCTCTDSTGKVIQKTTTSSNSRSAMEKFESDCVKSKYQEKENGVVVVSIPCKLS